MGVAVVTGAASGIGAALRRRLEAEGDRVVGVDLRDAEVCADLSSAAGRRAALEGVRAAAPGGLDRLAVCAGLGTHVEDLAAIVSVNYFGAVGLLDALRDDLRGRPGAAALAVCSNSARLGPLDDHPLVGACLDGDEPRAREIAAAENGYIAYAGSKHALCRAVRRRAASWGEAGVRLNGIAPGATRTPLLAANRKHPVWGPAIDRLPIPLGRPAEPEEIAAVAAFLLGPDAAVVHGSVVYADGGTDAAAQPDRF